MTSHPQIGAAVPPRPAALPGAPPGVLGNPASPQLHDQPPCGGAGTKTPALSRGLMTIALAMSEEQLLSNVTLGTRREPGMCKQLGLGWIHHRRSEMTNPGWPDLVIKAPVGRVGVIFRELKKQKGRVTPEQQEWLDALTAAGMDADVYRPSDYLSGRVARELAALAGIGAR